VKHFCLIACLLCAFGYGQSPELWGLADVGTATKGIIYKLNFDGSGYSVADTLQGAKGGNAPGSLLRAKNGTLYGMTLNGGANNFGIVFNYDVFTNTFSKIIDFNGINGKQPFGSLMEASDGKLYGMTQAGGAYNKGVIFSIDPNGNIYSKLYDFTILSGSIPAGNLVETSNGLLYGMTSSGGTTGFGTLFSFNTFNNGFIKLHNFNGTDGKSALGTLTEVNGKLYGMAYLGGAYTKGSIFSIDIATNTFTVVVNFNGTNGQNPLAGFLYATNGKLYGMTPNGGTYNSGVIFSLNPFNDSLVKEYDFKGGAGPNGSLMEASDGLLYGTTENGGSSTKGTVFNFDPATKAFNDIFTFSTFTYGYEPTGDVLEVKPVKVIPPTIFTPNEDGINDAYFIITSGVTELTCEIYNRWGQEVFTIKAVDEKWNGKWRNGEEATEGAYFYNLHAKTYDKKSHSLQGSFMLLK